MNFRYMPHIVFGIQKLILLTGLNQKRFKLAHKNAGQHKDLYLGAPNFEGFEVVL